VMEELIGKAPKVGDFGGNDGDNSGEEIPF